jgi:type IV pilus assembly protein PilA
MKNVKNVKKNNKGFSLVELIVVIAIMAVLVGVLAPQFIGYVSKSKKSTDIKNAQEIASAISVVLADESIVRTSTGAFAEVNATSGIGAEIKSAGLLSSIPTVKSNSTYKFYATYNADNGEVKIYCGKDLTDSTPDLDSKYMVYPTVGSEW